MADRRSATGFARKVPKFALLRARGHDREEDDEDDTCHPGVVVPGKKRARGAPEGRLGVVLIDQDKPDEILHFKKGRLVSSAELGDPTPYRMA